MTLECEMSDAFSDILFYCFHNGICPCSILIGDIYEIRSQLLNVVGFTCVTFEVTLSAGFGFL
jgi:hypothetical protein